jgi:spermidine synthase
MLFFNQKSFYVLSSFFAGFSIMVVELISTRIVAPIIGASVYTWTSVIGLTLLGLAIGGWFGGRIADKMPSKRPVSFAFLFSGICVSLIPILSGHTDFLTSSSTSILTLNLIISLYLFFIPACAIGTIQPLLLKNFADSFSSLGSKYGILSASWSLGSMVGVFLTGFFFISTIGSTETIYIVSALLFLLGIAYAGSDKKALLLFFVSACILVAIFYVDRFTTNENIVYEKETNYYSAKVIDTYLPLLGESRVLLLDLDVHSIDSPDSQSLHYTDMHPVFSYIKDDISSILVLGAGAYTLPKHFEEYYPSADVSVVEVDPEMVSIGNDYFNLKQYGIKTIVSDAKLFIHNDTKTYDVIFGDTYNSYISVPWYLLTKEWNDEVRTRLTPNGLYAINFIGYLDGDKSEFTKSVATTFARSFPHYYVFSFGKKSTDIQNIVLVGVNGDLPYTEDELIKKMSLSKHSGLSKKIVNGASVIDSKSLVLTNNFSPVEHLMSPIIHEYFSKNLLFIKKVLSEKVSVWE